MPSHDIYATYKPKPKKTWRYPGVPIPYRLRNKYEVKS